MNLAVYKFTLVWPPVCGAHFGSPGNSEVLKRVDERKTLIGSVVERSSSMVGHHSNWLTTLVEGRSGRGRPRQENMDEISGGRRYVVIKRLLIYFYMKQHV